MPSKSKPIKWKLMRFLESVAGLWMDILPIQMVWRADVHLHAVGFWQTKNDHINWFISLLLFVFHMPSNRNNCRFNINVVIDNFKPGNFIEKLKPQHYTCTHKYLENWAQGFFLPILRTWESFRLHSQYKIKCKCIFESQWNLNARRCATVTLLTFAYAVNDLHFHWEWLRYTYVSGNCDQKNGWNVGWSR